MLVAGGADPFPIIERGNKGCAADSFRDYGSDIAFFFENVLDVIGAIQITGDAAVERAVPVIGRRDMLATRQKRAGVLAENRFAAERDRVKRSAVEGVPHGDCFEATGRGARELEGHADGGSSARREKDAIQITGSKLRELFCEFNGTDIGVTARAEGEVLHLARDRVNYFWMTETDLVNVVAVKIEEATALKIFDVRA